VEEKSFGIKAVVRVILSILVNEHFGNGGKGFVFFELKLELLEEVYSCEFYAFALYNLNLALYLVSVKSCLKF